MKLFQRQIPNLILKSGYANKYWNNNTIFQSYGKTIKNEYSFPKELLSFQVFCMFYCGFLGEPKTKYPLNIVMNSLEMFKKLFVKALNIPLIPSQGVRTFNQS